MPNIDIVRTQLFPRKSIDNRRFTVVFQSLTCPAITGAEDGTFNLEEMGPMSVFASIGSMTARLTTRWSPLTN